MSPAELIEASGRVPAFVRAKPVLDEIDRQRTALAKRIEELDAEEARRRNPLYPVTATLFQAPTSAKEFMDPCSPRPNPG